MQSILAIVNVKGAFKFKIRMFIINTRKKSVFSLNKI